MALLFSGGPLLGSSLLDCVLEGLVGACGVSVLCNLMRVDLFLQSYSKCPQNPSITTNVSLSKRPAVGQLVRVFRFCLLTTLLTVVGYRLAILVVLEFSLRALLRTVTAGQSSPSHLLLVQSQFSLGCSLSCTLHFLQEGALRRTLCLFLAAGLSSLLAYLSQRVESHMLEFYPTHSRCEQQGCGVCVSLSSPQVSLLTGLSRAVGAAFVLGVVTSLHALNQHYITEVESVRTWIPLLLCYTLLLVYIQDGQARRPAAEALLRSALLRLGALLVLLLSLGFWVDILHLLLVLLGELLCLTHTQDLLHKHTPITVINYSGRTQNNP
ncbi:transmembrane protein 82-like [Colossoma macropomum]|uniref:transmembrane protein 82-like n=1 Tax=Colossoma macropomum TaxID=42526 RepID=UPI001864B139|nr:transmembrane protein 82-like [Colossoma macropomum]